MRVILIGRTEVLYNTALVLSEYFTICGILTAKAVKEYKKSETDFESLAKQLNCPFLLANNLNAPALEFIKTCNPDIGVSVNWVSVIGESVMKYIPLGILNCHPGNLPAYKGNAVCNWAMLRGDTEIVVTIHDMIPNELDSGDIYAQKVFLVNDNSTITDFINFWHDETPGLFLTALKGISEKSYNPIRQDDLNIQPFRCYPRLPLDSKIDWTRSAKEIHNLIRASTYPYSGAYTYIKIEDQIRKVKIWTSNIIANETKDIGTPGHIILNDRKSGESHVYTGEGILAITNLQYEDSEEIFLPGLTFKSIRIRFGIDVEQELILLWKYVYEKLG